MSIRVVYIPGILGSNLAWGPGPLGIMQRVWYDTAVLLGGGLSYLDLAPDGASPGPLAEGKGISVDGLFAPAYTPLSQWMRFLGLNVLDLPWDWRRSIWTVGQELWPVVRDWAAGSPIYFVAHSAGGLVARAIYAQMLAAGQDAQCARIVTLATPHYGSMEAVRLWWRLPSLYSGFTAVTGWVSWIPGRPGPDYLDDTVASMPSWYELMPWAAEGPLFQAAPEQAAEIYTPAFYQGANRYLSPTLLEGAELVQGLLSPAIPAGRMVSLYGVGVQTAYQLAPPAGPGSDAGYLWTGQGDGLVTAAQASPPGVQTAVVYGSHGLIPLLPDVWALLPTLLTG